MSEYLFQLIMFVIAPIILGRLLITKPTLFIRLVTTHVNPGNPENFRSEVQENVYWARTDPQVWIKKYPTHVKLLRLMAYILYAGSGIGILIILITLLSSRP
jgi:hypothetical protein